MKFKDLSQQSVECRSFGHMWRPYTAQYFEEKLEGVRSKWRGYKVTLVCKGCGCNKHFKLSHTGDYGHPYYRYPTNYKLDHRITPDERKALKLAAIEPWISK